MPSAADIIKTATAHNHGTAEPTYAPKAQIQPATRIPQTHTPDRSPQSARPRPPAGASAYVRAPVYIPQSGKREHRATPASVDGDLRQPITPVQTQPELVRRTSSEQLHTQPSEPERRSPPELAPQANPAFVPPPTRNPEIYKALMARHDRANQRHLRP